MPFETIKSLTDQLMIARNEINNLRQQLIKLKHSTNKQNEELQSKLENWQCQECRKKQVPSNVNSDANNSSETQFPFIGTIYTNFPEKRGTPRQPGICQELIGKLELNNNVFTNPEHALEGLEEYSHMWILFYFDKNGSTHVRAKVTPPRLNGHRLGVFATRSPHRPSPIGLSLVKIDRIVENIIYFSGVDMVNRTPVLDIKPYIPQYDTPNLANLSNLQTLPNDANYWNESSIRESIVNVTSESLDNLNMRDMDGEESEEGEEQRNVTVNPDFNAERTYISTRMGEREAPDGEEEESDRQASGISNTFSAGNVRTPAWISNPSVPVLTVCFRERALAQLHQIGTEGEMKKLVIENILKEDPRSIYLRERIESSNYVFRIAELYVSCRFDDRTHTVTVFQVFQNEQD